MNDLHPRDQGRTTGVDAPYRPPAWLKNPHAQTIYAACVAPRPYVELRRERWNTPDGDFIDLDWLHPGQGTVDASLLENTPLIVLFHGLEGSSRSHYARTLMRAVDRRRWRGVVVHFRGCSGEPNRLARAYHSGDTVEMAWILERLRAQWPGPLCAVAVSLGANVLLKWLGESGPSARRILAAACAVSAPLDLMATGGALDRGFNRIYSWNFLRTLKRKSLEKARHHPHIGNEKAIRAATTLKAFDDQVTSRLHGFRDAHDYWTQSSSKPWLKHIAVPTLVLNARDDPFLPAWALPKIADVSPTVMLDFPAHGGHVAFVTGRFPGSLEWLPTRVLRYIDRILERHNGEREAMA